jgi:hypothetical protein
MYESKFEHQTSHLFTLRVEFLAIELSDKRKNSVNYVYWSWQNELPRPKWTVPMDFRFYQDGTKSPYLNSSFSSRTKKLLKNIVNILRFKPYIYTRSVDRPIWTIPFSQLILLLHI